MPNKKKKPDKAEAPGLFNVDDYLSEKPGDGLDLKGNVWTHQKAQLISRYLHSFLAVTKNGIYIDAFAGPQDVESRDKTWAAKQILSRKSNFLNRACLFEQDESKIPHLLELKKQYCQGWRRLSDLQVVVAPGDCNEEIPNYLRQHRVKQRRAGFALLDQRTHECTWALVKTLAAHKQAGTKIEIFYFLAQGWMNRSFKSARRDEKFSEIDAWWGNDQWGDFVNLSSFQRAMCMQARFKDELNYRFTKAFPMRQRGNSGSVLFWLIHASDHPRAIPLMAAAYRSIGLRMSEKAWEQTDIDDFLQQ